MKEYVISEMGKMTKNITLEDYKDECLFKTPADVHEFVRECGYRSGIVNNASSTYHYQESKEAYLLTVIRPTYACMERDLPKFKEGVDRILEGIAGNDELTDIQKAMLIHDRLIIQCKYDDADINEKMATDAHSGWGALVDHDAVCSGYASAYCYLLEQVGIKSEFCPSVELDHVWNIVYIDDVPYHVDVTWDDMSTYSKGYVSHENFLVSSDKLYETHIANDYPTYPKEKKFDHYFWQDSKAEFQLFNGSVYYIDNDKETLNEWQGEDSVTLLKIKDTWGRYDKKGFNYSTLTNDGERLLYSLSDAIYAYDTDSGVSEVVYQPVELDQVENGSIYGFEYSEGEYLCDISDMPLLACEIEAIEHTLTAQTAWKYGMIGVATIVFMFVAVNIRKRKQKRKLRRKNNEETDIGRIEEV